MSRLNGDGVDGLLRSAAGKVVVVLGDLMLDEWLIGQASRMSPEAPVPVVRFTERRTAPGGAANVAMILLKLGAEVRICGVVGNDEAGADLSGALVQAGADVNGLVQDRDRPTTLKTRIVAQHQQMLRIDRESEEPLAPQLRERVEHALEETLRGAALLCISDYDKGLAGSGLLERAIALAGAGGLRVTGGPKPHNLRCFKQAHFLSLNRKEASEASGLRIDSSERVEQAGAMLQAQTGCEALVITQGEHGATLFQPRQTPVYLAPHQVEMFDVTGAGDAFLSAASIALAGGAGFTDAAMLGNLAGAASVRHVGVVAVTPEELRLVGQE